MIFNLARSVGLGGVLFPLILSAHSCDAYLARGTLKQALLFYIQVNGIESSSHNNSTSFLLHILDRKFSLFKIYDMDNSS